MKRSLAPLAGVTLALLFTGAPARADFVPWKYNWTPSTLLLTADAPGTGGISLTNEPTGVAEGTSDIVATNLRTFSSALRKNGDKVAQGTYTLTMSLTDGVSNETGVFKFTGYFSGGFSATNADIDNFFTGETSQTQELGGHTYTVTIGPYAPPGPPTAVNAGSISAFVAVDEFTPPGNGGGPGPVIDDTPEPSTMVLSCLGLSFLGAASWRKWKRGPKDPAALA